MSKNFSSNNPKAWELDLDPVWEEQEDCVMPKPFFLRWWQTVARKRYGSVDQWLKVAYELGYVVEIIECKSGKTFYEPYGFDYDPIRYRTSLGIPVHMPLISETDSGNQEIYERMWDWLLQEGG